MGWGQKRPHCNPTFQSIGVLAAMHHHRHHSQSAPPPTPWAGIWDKPSRDRKTYVL